MMFKSIREYEIKCIVKPDPHGIYESIEKIGYGGTLLTSPILISREEAARQIENGEAKFYVLDKKTGDQVFIEVYEEDGKKYIRTEPDGKKYNNLLELPQCK